MLRKAFTYYWSCITDFNKRTVLLENRKQIFFNNSLSIKQLDKICEHECKENGDNARIDRSNAIIVAVHKLDRRGHLCCGSTGESGVTHKLIHLAVTELEGLSSFNFNHSVACTNRQICSGVESVVSFLCKNI